MKSLVNLDAMFSDEKEKTLKKISNSGYFFYSTDTPSLVLMSIQG